MTTLAPQPPVRGDQLARFDVAGPRYTSYPTADRFVEAFDAAAYRRALQDRTGAGRAIGALGASAGTRAPLSVYVHIPFCESLCYYCACNKVITKHHERAAEYLDALEREIALHTAVLGAATSVSQLHFGGGSPTFLTDAELARLMAALRGGFRLLPDAELSIEVDPRTVTPERLQHLAALGFNRLSFGVQDFDPDVQKAVHRVQPYESVLALMASARRIGFQSINVDLIYGLPKQTPESFQRTLAQVRTLRPDRIALYAYAHLPERFKPQRRIVCADLPAPAHKIAMLAAAIDALGAEGYDYIGMDHFALRDDALAVAKRQGRLHRNFQGYSTQPDCDLLGLGVSAIGKVGASYSQNAKTLPEYYDALRNGVFPVVRGLALERDDLIRRAVIMAVMCQGRVDYESIDAAHLVRFADYFAPELERLRSLAEQGLVELEDDGLQVTPLGWYFVRAVAMVFDKPLQAERCRARFSRIV
ncbi:oxygen-independent coproporphyrinogen III oxidase [Aquincola sp. S2]|uniref:Coproporphyrinogen-III oxidase n=1 Tax=Pseudaquabacterium terrae TaxID=2732868 RepID=A0ABX2EQR3_9BURK|nr:oxygen-independent coproporphyrinogen III oxidase [Aquabacterium terrae]NRF70971.1 oxygen-independent coproporphyrinogen III oxidase [Aquabacterium terrae]